MAAPGSATARSSSGSRRRCSPWRASPSRAGDAPPGIGAAGRGPGPYSPRMVAVLSAYRSLLRNRPLAWLLGGEFVSSIGDWLYLVAILLLVSANAPITTIVALAVVATCFSTFFGPAIGAYLPSLVADEAQLGPANSAWSTLDNLAYVVGPAIGGLLIAAGGLVLAFVLNAATFAVIATVLWRLPSPRRAATGPGPMHD